MRDRSQTTPRRRGPKMPVPRARSKSGGRQRGVASESPYYTIDNTEDIYGTTLHPSERCYVDPWDLENYDYVRKKINSTTSPGSYYDPSLSPTPPREPTPPSQRYYGVREHRPMDEFSYEPEPRMAMTMPRNHRRSSHLQCELECCVPQRRFDDFNSGHGLYGGAVPVGTRSHTLGRIQRSSRYDDYLCRMAENMMDDEDAEQNIYTGYGGISSSSSTEHQSSIGEDSAPPLIGLHRPGYRTSTHRRGMVVPKSAPHIDFPAPPSIPPTYDYCNPYATLPYCSVSDCYECLSQAQQNSSLIYAAPSVYGSTSIYGGIAASNASTLGRRPSSSLYAGIYANKFALSKKGLLQIDYSCSWNDLDRVIGRQY